MYGLFLKKSKSPLISPIEDLNISFDFKKLLPPVPEIENWKLLSLFIFFKTTGGIIKLLFLINLFKSFLRILFAFKSKT